MASKLFQHQMYLTELKPKPSINMRESRLLVFAQESFKCVLWLHQVLDKHVYLCITLPTLYSSGFSTSKQLLSMLIFRKASISIQLTTACINAQGIEGHTHVMAINNIWWKLTGLVTSQLPAFQRCTRKMGGPGS